MPVYSKGIETKKKFIQLTFEKLFEADASELTVRNLARDIGCSAATLYRHFDSLDDLIAIASIKFVDEYIREYGKLLDSDEDMLTIYLKGWKLFNSFAFVRPAVYLRLFWGKDSNTFGNAFQEYLEMFPIKGSEKFTAHYYTLLFNENMQQRDLTILKILERKGYIGYKGAEYLSYTNPLIVRGMLEEASYLEKEKRLEEEMLCFGLIEKNTMHTLEISK